jgi:hypothetical protein
MPRIAIAAFACFCAVFTAAFALGVVRVLYVAPQTGPLAAVALEVPVILALSWVVAGQVLRRWRISGATACLWLGGLAFACLMAAETALAVTVFGSTVQATLRTMATWPGALGLAGQIGFALIPALRDQTKG